MLRSAEHRRMPFRTVLMDNWYATKDLMLLIDGMGEKKKTFYCPLKSNRQVDGSGGEKPYQRVDELDWSEEELKKGNHIACALLVWSLLKDLAYQSGGPSTGSSTAYCKTISSNNSRIPLFRWFL